MSLRLEMLQVARLAPQLLHNSSDLIRQFVLGQLRDDGGFSDREGDSDLYYTVFGLESLLALHEPLPDEKVESIKSYLASFEDGSSLDLVHLACLARAHADLNTLLNSTSDRRPLNALRPQAKAFQSSDGGYANAPGSQTGTVYGCFLALGLDHDTAGPDSGTVEKEPLLSRDGVEEFLASMATNGGGYANESNMRIGSTAATAAAVAVARHLGLAVSPDIAPWLLDTCFREGGFCASPLVGVPDLLSTATALHTLAALEFPFGTIQEICLDYIDTLWSSRGGFYGHWADDVLDCEYTYYGLLALGHLSL